jgi:hypothetical protein
MNGSLQKVLSALVCMGAVVAVEACASDDSPSGAAGTAGAGGAGGAAGGGTGGASGTGGAAGTNAGTGGAGGAGAGGASGTSGGMGGAGGAGAGGASGTMGGAGGAGAGGDSGDGGDGGTMADSGVPPEELEPFSFFVTSYEAMVRLSGTEDGFGGDLRYDGAPDGLSGADKICTEIAEHSMPGASAKGWRAFLSVAQDGGGERVDAIDRIGDGPWFDRLGRTVAETTDDLQNERPEGADDLIYDDLPNEYGVPNHRPDPTGPEIDNHHVLTGSDGEGRLYQGNVNGTCGNWTELEDAGRPRIGFSWSIDNRVHWISGQDEGGCGAGYDLDGGGGSDPNNPVVGSGGGYGAIYCFALMP